MWCYHLRKTFFANLDSVIPCETDSPNYLERVFLSERDCPDYLDVVFPYEAGCTENLDMQDVFL